MTESTQLAITQPAASQLAEALYPPLSTEEEDFCLAVIEFEGNIGKAYRAVFGDEELLPAAKGKALLANPAMALRIKSITDAVGEAALISVGAHLDSLARIRDLSIAQGEMKVAYQAERSRGEAVGIYQKHEKGGGGGNQVAIQIVMASKHDETI